VTGCRAPLVMVAPTGASSVSSRIDPSATTQLPDSLTPLALRSPRNPIATPRFLS
jgi:hypothetical protein